MRAAFAVILLLPFLTVPDGSAARHAPGVAATVSGAVWTMRSDGSSRHRLTPRNTASFPDLSPDEKLVSYVTISPACTPPRAPGSDGPPPPPNTLVVESSSGGHRWWTCGGGSQSWSPNGRLIAYFNRQTLYVVQPNGRRPEALLKPDRFYGYVYAAWSPDSTRLAVPLWGPGSGLFQDRTLRLAMVDLHGSVRRIVIRFPPGSLGVNNWGNPGNPRGSFPTYNHVTWSHDGRHLLVETAGNSHYIYLTGIWEVSPNGGPAHLIAGTPAGVRETSNPGPALDHSMGFSVSPDGRLLATNPWGRLWVGDLTGRSGRYLTPPGCPVQQARWLSDSSELAYVQSCKMHGTYGSTLSVVSVKGGTPRLLVKAAGGDVDLGAVF